VANYNVDIEVGLKGLQKLGEFEKKLKTIEESYVSIELLNKRAANQKLSNFYKGSRETLIKLAGDQMKLDSMLKQGAEIRAGYAKDRKEEQQRLAEAQQSAVAQQIADEKKASIAAKNASVQRLNDQTKIVKLFRQAEEIRELHRKNQVAGQAKDAANRKAAIIAEKNEQLKSFSVKAENERKFRSLFEQGEKIRQSYAADRLAGIKLEIQLEEELNKTRREGIAADQRANRARQDAVDRAEKDLALRNRGRAQQQKDRKKFFNAAVTGGAFPLLFGGGVGQSLGGLIGGGLSGEMFSGATVGLQVLGSAIDRFVAGSADLGKALDPISGDFEAVAEAAGFANTATLQHIQTIEELGGENRALEIATAELTRVVGADGVAALNRFGTASKDLGNATAEIASQAFATIASALEPLTKAAAEFLKTTSAVGQAQVSEDPRLKAVRGEIKERMRTYDNQFGGMNNLQNRQAIRDLRAEELSLVELIAREQQVSIELEAKKLKLQKEVEALNLKTKRQLEIQEDLLKAGNDLTNKRVSSLLEQQIQVDYQVKVEEKLEEMVEAEIDMQSVLLKLKEMELDRDKKIADLQERVNKALEKATKDGQKIAEQKAKELEQAKDLAREFSREVQLRQSSSDVAKDLLQIQFEHEDRIKKINELENQSLRTEQLKSAELLNQLQIRERLAKFATTRTEEEVARDDLNREIALLAAKLKGTEEEFLLQEKLTALKAAMGETGRDEIQIYEEQLRQLKNREKQEDALNERLRIQKAQTAELQNVYKQIGQTIETGVVEAISAAVDKTKTLGEVASNVLRQIANQLLQMGVSQLIGSIFNPFGPLMAPGGRYEGQKGPLPAVPPPLPPIPKALGGAVGAGRPYMVGERGPELFVPGAQGNIVPNNAMGGANIVVNVDASGTAVQGDQGNGEQLGRLIGAAVQAELIKQKRPGGLLTR
jgi:hypothetical protein|tara:strand:- start:660 stop:3491 length:2832 start_codon:yes stop_codon:yes gene_type:complete